LLRRILEAIRRVANILVEMAGQIFDFHLAFARHWTARFRRRFINADAGVFSLADEVDFVKFCRELKKPTDPELQEWREWNDPFEGVTKFYNA
jgi:hypothetical protein